MEHGPKAAKSFAKLIKQTAPKNGKPGKNRSLVIGNTPKQPVVLVSVKKPTSALAELKTMSKDLGPFTPVAIGKAIFENGEIHVKVLKDANEAAVKKAFLGYFKLYKLSPPSNTIRLLWQPDDLAAIEFEEDPEDTGEDEDETGEGETDEADGSDDAGDPDSDQADAEDEGDEEDAEDERAEELERRIETATAQLKKIAGLLAAHPEMRQALVTATKSLSDARARLSAGAVDEADSLIHAAQGAMAEAAHLVRGGGTAPNTSTVTEDSVTHEEDETEEEDAEEDAPPPTLKQPTKPLLPIWVEAKDEADAEIGKLQDRLRETEDEDLTQIADYGLYGATTGQGVKLMAALRDADSTKSPDALRKLLAAVEDYEDYMDGAGSELFDLIEQNDFRSVPLRAILRPALDAITKQLVD